MGLFLVQGGVVRRRVRTGERADAGVGAHLKRAEIFGSEDQRGDRQADDRLGFEQVGTLAAAWRMREDVRLIGHEI